MQSIYELSFKKKLSIVHLSTYFNCCLQLKFLAQKLLSTLRKFRVFYLFILNNFWVTNLIIWQFYHRNESYVKEIIFFFFVFTTNVYRIFDALQFIIHMRHGGLECYSTFMCSPMFETKILYKNR